MAGLLNPNSLNGAARTLFAAHPAASAPALATMLGAMPQWAATPLKTRNYAAHQAMKPAATLPPPLPPPVAPSAPVVPVFRDETKDGRRTIEVTDSDSIRTLDELLAAADVDLLDWEVERFTVNKWDVTMKGPDALPVVASNWQVKANLVPNTKLTALTVEAIAELLAPLVKRTGAAFRPKRHEAREDYLLELGIFDLHLGKLADPLESGEAYNLEIAAALYEMAVDVLLERAAGYPVGTVLIPLGNDYYNSDSMIGATTKGTPQHEAGRWQSTFVRGVSLQVATINRIRNRGYKVKIVMVPGNHDFQSNFYLGQVIQATFAGCDDVEIDATFKARKYVRFHDCGIMYTHSNEEKEGNLAMLFAQEEPQLWAATRFREAHLAHVHHKKEFRYRVQHENVGLTVRYLRSLAAADAWHFLKGYVGSQRSAEGFVWARGEGVVAHLTFTYTNQDLPALA